MTAACWVRFEAENGRGEQSVTVYACHFLPLFEKNSPGGNTLDGISAGELAHPCPEKASQALSCLRQNHPHFYLKAKPVAIGAHRHQRLQEIALPHCGI